MILCSFFLFTCLILVIPASGVSMPANLWRRWLVGALASLLLLNTSHADELWLAVGYGGRRMISTDGKNWKVTAEWAQPGGDDGHNLMSAVYWKATAPPQNEFASKC